MPKNKKTIKRREALLFISAISTVLILSVVNLITAFNSHHHNPQTVIVETDYNQEVIENWKKILQENPNYLPGWLELAKLEIQNKNLHNAFVATNKALEINPNSDEVKKIIKDFNI